MAEIKRSNKDWSINIRPYRLTLNGRFIREGDVLPYYVFPKPFLDNTRGILFPGLDVFNDCHFLELEIPKPFAQEWSPEEESNVFSILFGEEYRPRDESALVLSLATSSQEFYPTWFITNQKNEPVKDITWTEEENRFTVTVGNRGKDFQIESSLESTTFAPDKQLIN